MRGRIEPLGDGAAGRSRCRAPPLHGARCAAVGGWIFVAVPSPKTGCRHLVRRRHTGDERDFRRGPWGRRSGNRHPAPVNEESERYAGLRCAAIGIRSHGPNWDLSGQILLRRLLRDPTAEAKDRETGGGDRLHWTESVCLSKKSDASSTLETCERNLVTAFGQAAGVEVLSCSVSTVANALFGTAQPMSPLYYARRAAKPKIRLSLRLHHVRARTRSAQRGPAGMVAHFPFFGTKRRSAKACTRAETSIVLSAAAFFFVAILGDVLIDDSAALLVCLLACLARRLATDWRRFIGRTAEQDRRQIGDRRGRHCERQQHHSAPVIHA